MNHWSGLVIDLWPKDWSDLRTCISGLLRCKPKFLDSEDQLYYHKQSVRVVGIGKEYKRLFWINNLDSSFLLPQWVVASHEGKAWWWAFTQMVNFLSMKAPCKSGLGIALEHWINVVALHGVRNRSTGKVYKMYDYKCTKYVFGLGQENDF